MGTDGGTTTTAQDAVDAHIQRAIAQYLHFKDFEGTLAALQVDLEREQHRQSSENGGHASLTGGTASAAHAGIGRTFLEAFDTGAAKAFFRLWTKHVPEYVRDSDSVALKLEFYLHIHFALFPVRLALLDGKPVDAAGFGDSMQIFKGFLADRGYYLARTTEFLPYYALPYVANPADHPSFTGVFDDAWLEDLRGRLDRFLRVVLRSVASPELYARFSNDSAGLTEQLKQQYAARENRLRLLGYAALSAGEDLLLLLRRMETEDTFDPVEARDLMHAASVKFTEFRRTLDDGPPGSAASGMDGTLAELPSESHLSAPDETLSMTADPPRSIAIGRVSPAGLAPAAHGTVHHPTPPAAAPSRARTPPAQPITPPAARALDIPKLRADLTEFVSQADTDAASKTIQSVKLGRAGRKCCLLLQALRWRLSRAGSSRARKEVVLAYSEKDLLGCRQPISGTGGAKTLLRRLLHSGAALVRESAARLVNTMASEKAGRTYLLEDESLVRSLVHVMKSESSDTGTRQNALGALQKFSLRRQPQVAMISGGVIEWLVNTLRMHTTAMGTMHSKGQLISEYSIEYATALLMNLALHSDGKLRAARLQTGVLEVLADFLENDNPQVRTYINGTLYSLLGNAMFKEKARSIGLDAMLQGLLQHSDGQFQHQLQYILQQYQAPPIAEEPEMDTDDDEVDEDEMEDEDDGSSDAQSEFLEIDPGSGELAGDKLLASMYVVGGAAAAGGGGGLPPRPAPGGRPPRPKPVQTQVPEQPPTRAMTPSLARRAPPTGGTSSAQATLSKPRSDRAIVVVDTNAAAQESPRQALDAHEVAARAVGVPAEYSNVFQTRSKIVRTPAVGNEVMWNDTKVGRRK